MIFIKVQQLIDKNFESYPTQTNKTPRKLKKQIFFSETIKFFNESWTILARG